MRSFFSSITSWFSIIKVYKGEQKKNIFFFRIRRYMYPTKDLLLCESLIVTNGNPSLKPPELTFPLNWNVIYSKICRIKNGRIHNIKIKIHDHLLSYVRVIRKSSRFTKTIYSLLVTRGDKRRYSWGRGRERGRLVRLSCETYILTRLWPRYLL